MFKKKIFISICLLIKLSQISAENCPDCPLNQKNEQHRELIKWSDFHCDQIRQLKMRVDSLEAVLGISDLGLDKENQDLYDKLTHLENTIHEQSEKIKLQQEAIDNLKKGDDPW